MRRVRCDGCNYVKYGDGDQGTHVFTKALSNLQLNQYEREIHFNDSMSNLQKVEMKYMYTEWLELLQNSVLKIHKFSTLGHPGGFTETSKQTAINIYLFHDLPAIKQ